MVVRPWARRPLLALGMLALVSGVWGGLLRLGWAWPTPSATLVGAHGPLMVAGFLGTVIGLERAVALGRPWAYTGPLFAGLGAVALALGVAVGPALVTVGSLVFVGATVGILRRQVGTFTALGVLGGVAWLAGNLLWLSAGPLHEVLPWWAAFLILTIAGERLELARLRPASRASARVLHLALALLLVGTLLTLAWLDLGVRITGIGSVALALWLARWDIASRTVRAAGLTRYVAVCLLGGYAWLAVAGVLSLVGGAHTGGPSYDAAVHALLLGFVFSMIFGHAPLIAAALLGMPVGYQPTFYVHLVLLHLSLVARVGADLLGLAVERRWSGLFNAVALLVFLANTVYGVWRAGRQPSSGRSQTLPARRADAPRR